MSSSEAEGHYSSPPHRTDNLHISARYARPSNQNHVHPDLTFQPAADAVNLFIKPAPTQKRKRPSDTTPTNFWEDREVLRARKIFQGLSRSTPTIPDGSLELFIVDVVDAVCPLDQVPPSIQRKCPEINQGWPVVQVAGISLEDGASVCMRVWGFFPYILAECPAGFEKLPDACRKVRDYFENNLTGMKDVRKKIVDVEMLPGESLWEYVPERPKVFFKIKLALQRLVPQCRSLLESGIRIDGYQFLAQAFEANLQLTLRWMIDTQIVGCGCLAVQTEQLTNVTAQNRSTRCQLEFDVHCDYVSALPTDGKYAAVPDQLRVLSMDIECVTVESQGFPVPESDPVIQISSILTSPGKKQPTFKIVFTLDTCAPIAGATVISFEDERSMLAMWREFVIYSDPDIITGYNMINFDLNYLVLRSKQLDIPTFRNLGRVINVETKIRDATMSSKGLGTHEMKDINIEGRIQFDAFELVRREYKLKSYSLNGVSAHFLKEQKEDVHYTQIGDLQRGCAESRKRIAVYCLKDSWLVIRLLEALSFLVNYIEMARVTGVPMSVLLTRGQQIKVTSQLIRKCRDMGYFMPTLKSSGSPGDVQYEGATVLDPMRDFYDIPIGTLDFASLYPSIMIAHNLCYTTLVHESQLAKYGLKEDDIFRTPAHKIFVKKHIRAGILPTVVADLLSARKVAKKDLAVATDPLMRMVLDGRQLALKISANSVYGYTGAAAIGHLPMLAISESITAYGRSMIEFTKAQVENRFRKENGYEHDAVVVYGDTDSVMVKFGPMDVGKVMDLGREAAQYVSDQFTKPIALEFEKAYFPFLLMNKKRYAGLMWSKPEKWSKIDCKGIETVRRDFCLLVQQMVDDALKALLINRDVEGAREMTKKRIQDLLMNRIDMSYLVLSKSLGKEDYAAKLAHVELAKKLRKRDPATAPNIGDRVYYVIVAGAKGQAQYERAEDPIYAVENNIPIDVDFYLDSIKNPITRIFEPIEKANIESLFTGEHTRQKKLVTSSTGALSKFVTAGLRCLGCRAVIPSGAFCEHCKENKEREVILDKMTDYRQKEAEYHQLWVECQRCQESLHQDVICTSRDCPIFYRRMKIKKEAGEYNRTTMSRLNLEDW